jgi:hypothetical protein
LGKANTKAESQPRSYFSSYESPANQNDVGRRLGANFFQSGQLKVRLVVLKEFVGNCVHFVGPVAEQCPGQVSGGSRQDCGAQFLTQLVSQFPSDSQQLPRGGINAVLVQFTYD